MGTDNAFAELGLASGATEREVKAAWRRMVSQWHPDRNASADAVARMQRINQAFEEIHRSGILTRPAADGPDSAEPAAAETADTADAASDHTQASDDAATASRTTGTSGTQRPPIQRKVKLTLEEAAAGCIKVLRGKVTGVCSTCEGAGHQVLGGHCAQCGGSGAIAKRSWFGWPGGLSECEACLGGGIARQPCPDCDGSGSETRHYKISVRIPHGVRHGDLLHVDGGRARSDGPPADLEIRIEVPDHAFFKLDDDGTTRCEIPVDGFAWIANRLIQVPTLAGLQPLQLSRDQLSYRLKAQGFPVERRGRRGDHVVTLLPVFPDSLSTDQDILLDQLIATSSTAAGKPRDDRLAAWNRSLRSWERGLSGRDR